MRTLRRDLRCGSNLSFWTPSATDKYGVSTIVIVVGRKRETGLEVKQETYSLRRKSGNGWIYISIPNQAAHGKVGGRAVVTQGQCEAVLANFAFQSSSRRGSTKLMKIFLYHAYLGAV